MSMQSTSHSLLSRTDGFAIKSSDTLILIGRIMLAWIFVGSAYGAVTNFAGSIGYFTSLKVPAPPLLFTWLALVTELLLSAGLILGIGTRYCAILAFVFVLVATALGHRYWEYPAAQQTGQYINFLKNISIMGGALAIFVTGGGRFSLDRMLAK
jgi:putative oxidoreductase